jgi:hypothetical protein
MSTPTPINTLEYLKHSNVQSTQKIFYEYFKDIINSYGIRVNYFRQDTTFPNDLRSAYEDLIYEENYPTTYCLSAEIPLYLEVNTDAFILTKHGLEPDQHYTVFCTVKDFEFAFANLAQQHVVSSVVSFNIPIISGSGILSSSFNSSDGFLSGVISGSVVPSLSGVVSGVALAQYYNYSDYIFINDEIAAPSAWNYVKTTFSSYHGPFTGIIDVSGNGVVSGTLSGIIVYKKLGDFESNIFKKIKPLPKDYFSIPFPTDTPEQFEITDVIDRNLAPGGINPLFAKYLFACNVVRRTYSNEDGMSEPEIGTNIDMIDIEHKIKEYSSDQLFDYNLSGTQIESIGMDKIYGGF